MTIPPRAPFGIPRSASQTFLLLSLLTAACGSTSPTYTLSKTAANASPKPANCEFEVVTTQSEKPYEEVGILDAVVVPYAATNAAELKAAVQEQVCEVGGDAVYAEVNGRGRYVRGTILRWRTNGDS